MRRDVFLEFAFPNKLSEYIVAGKAVMMPRLKTIRHYFSDDALAYFEPGDRDGLARQMLRLYGDPELRARLAARAREEYAPIRWEIMKQRYLKVMEDLTRDAGPAEDAPRTTVAPDRPSARTAALKLLAYCRANDWAGHDPYDALNSRLFRALPFLDARIPRLVLTQALKRSPVDVRGWVGVPPTQNPKALGLFLAAMLKLSRAGVTGLDDQIEQMIRRLASLRSPGVAAWCWGYSFPWQTRTIVVPRGAPNLVCTSFVGGALLDAAERGDSRCLGMAASAAEWIQRDLYWRDGDGAAGFAYPLTSSRSRVHNANFLGAAFLCRVSRLTGDERFLEPALTVARYSAARQRDDGSWHYGEGSRQRWIDNFHTGYNLCALASIGRDAETSEFEDQVRRGMQFYRTHFFRHDGAPRYFHDRTYPIDSHCVAQALITLVASGDPEPDDVRLAGRVLDWALDHLWDERGFFYYRVLRSCTIRTSYMRWTQAWMLLALATVLESRAAALLARERTATAA
jgi:hypothetical protein